MKHFIKTQQLNRDIISELFSLADSYSQRPSSSILSNKIIATLFYQPSTRTRFSFESAGLRLGASIISSESANVFSSAVKGESLEDTIRVVSGLCDAIVLRHPDRSSSRRASLSSEVPIINAGSANDQHPTQALIDLYTIKKEIGHINGCTVAMVGDLKNGRTIRSLAYLLGKYDGIRLQLISPEKLSLKSDIKMYLDKHEVEYHEGVSFSTALKTADVIYMTRVQEEWLSKKQKNIVQPFSIDASNISLLRNSSRILHPLPKLKEIDLPRSIEQSDKRVAYFRQAANALPVRMAILDYLMHKK